jgi:hypothetical protein
MQHAWEDGRNMYKIILKPEGKRPFGKSRRRWEGDVRYEVMNGFSWQIHVNMIISIRIP